MKFHFRPDNADIRLTEKGYKIGLVFEERYQRSLKIRADLDNATTLLKNYVLPSNTWREKFGLKLAKNSVEKR